MFYKMDNRSETAGHLNMSALEYGGALVDVCVSESASRKTLEQLPNSTLLDLTLLSLS